MRSNQNNDNNNKKFPRLTFTNKFLITSALIFVFACSLGLALISIGNVSTINPANPDSYYQTYANYTQSHLTVDDYGNSLLQVPGSTTLGNASSGGIIEQVAPKPDSTTPRLPQLELPRRPTGSIVVSGAQLTDKNGTRFFIAGVNYEGHTDRDWKMWDEGQFDANLIDSDLALAAAGGYNTLRIFVRASLRDDILKGNFAKLDKVVELSEKYGLRLLITFADYDELDLNKLIPIESAVAKHYAGSPVVLGYDLKNEPQFTDIVGAIYPAGVTPPLQTDALIKAYGERISQADAARWRQSGEGNYIVPDYMDAYHAYLIANAYKLYQEYLASSDKWVAAHPDKTVVDFPFAPEANGWHVFLDGLNGTLQNWIEVQQNAIKAAEAEKEHKPITIGFDRLVFAALPAQNSLGFVSLHRYAFEGYNGLQDTINILDSLHRTFGGKPVTLEEFGYSNAHGPHDTPTSVSPQITAQAETVLWLHLYSQGFGGGFKWMLTNYPPGWTPEQNNFGLLDDQTRPKPSYYAARAVMAHTLINQTPEGGFTNLDELPGNGIGYNFTSPNAVFSDSDNYAAGNRFTFTQAGRDPWGVWWPANGLGWIYVSSTGTGRLVLNLKTFFPAYAYNPKQPPTLRATNNPKLAFDSSGDTIAFDTAPGVFYVLNVPSAATPFAHAEPLGGNSLYFKETGHNLSHAFKNYWEQHGGVNIFGFPLSEEFNEDGHTVQYFERARFEYHPDLAGTDHEIQLGLLGKQAVDTFQTKTPSQAVTAFNSSADHLYFPQTGHSLANGFKAYWEQHGGVNEFGYPLTEEFSEVNALDGKTYVVQYFERARFEYRAELKGTSQEIQLGLLGMELVKKHGWLS